MIICFDLRALQIGHENRGIGMYLKSVLEHLDAKEHKLVFYAFDRNDPIETLGIKLKSDYSLVQTPLIKTSLNSPKDALGLFKLIGHTFKPLRRFKPDVFVQFDFTLGIPRWRRTRNVVIGYDLIPLIKKNEYLPTVFFAWSHSLGKKAKLRAVARSLYYRLKYRLHYRAYKRADDIITISKATTESFAQMLGIPQGKLHSIPLAPVISADPPDASILKTVKKPYVLYVGGTDSRKRIQDIIFAFNIARGRGVDMRLVLAGNEFSKLEHLPSIEGRNAIIKSSYRGDIIFAGFVSDAQKKALYEGAHAFIFCSSYEGFGLPIIEAMSLSCPVISYDNSSIPEAAGDAALLVETGDYTSIANRIIDLSQPAMREEIIKKGLQQAKKFSWHIYMTDFVKVITSKN